MCMLEILAVNRSESSVMYWDDDAKCHLVIPNVFLSGRVQSITREEVKRNLEKPDWVDVKDFHRERLSLDKHHSNIGPLRGKAMVAFASKIAMATA